MKRFLNDPDIRERIEMITDGKRTKSGELIGGDYYRNMRYMLASVASQGKNSVFASHQIFHKIRRNLSRAYLAEPSKGALQISSFVIALHEVPALDFISGVGDFILHPKQAWTTLNKSPIIPSRYFNQVLELRELGTASKTQGAPRRGFRNSLFWFVRTGNKVGVMMGGWAVYKHTLKQTGSEIEAFRAFDKFTNNFQQSGIPEQLSPAMTGGWRFVYQFISAPVQYSRYYIQSFADVAKGSMSVDQFARVLLVYHGLIPWLRWWIRSWFGGDDDKKALVGDMIKGPFSGIPIFSDVIDVAALAVSKGRPFSSGSPSSTAIDQAKQKLLTAIRKAADEDSDFEETMNAFASAGKKVAIPATGTPSWIMDMLQAAYMTSQGDFEADQIPGVIYGHSVEAMKYYGKQRDKRDKR